MKSYLVRISILKSFLNRPYFFLIRSLMIIPKYRRWLKRNSIWYNKFLSKSNKVNVLAVYFIQNIEKYIYRKLFQTSILEAISIAVNKKCNLSCNYCYQDKLNQDAYIKKKLFDRIIKRSNETKQFDIIGGEPFSEPKKLFHLLDSHDDRFFFIYTNGTLLTKSVLQKIRKYQNIIIMISFDGWIESEKNRGVSSLKMESLFKLLDQQDICFGISINVYSENFSDVVSDKFIEEMLGYGCFAFKFSSIIGIDNFSLNNKELTFFKEWFLHAKKKFFGLWGSPCINTSKGCCAGIKTIHISCSGNIYPCPHISMSTGNILQQSLDQVLNTSFFLKLRQYSKNLKDPLKKCLPLYHQNELNKIIYNYQDKFYKDTNKIIKENSIEKIKFK